MFSFMATVSFTFLIISCASVGETFNYQKRNSLVLGKTTIAEAIQQLGKPAIKSVKTNSKGNFNIIQYAFAKANMGGAASRVLLLEFKDNKLNAKIYNSAFKEDNTEFNFFQHQNIKVGQSNQEEVLLGLGTPSGMAIYPTTVAGLAGECMEGTSTIWTWIHTNKSNGLDTKTIKSKSVVIAFNGEGIVIKKEMATDL